MNNLDEKIFEKYLSGTCTEAEMNKLCQWFEASEENRKEWLKIRMALVKKRYTISSEPKHLQSSYIEIRQQQQEYEKLKKRITRKIMQRFATYAACFLLLIGVSFAFYKSVKEYINPPMVVVAVEKGQPAQRIVLGDSTAVWISANSRIEYPKKFSKKERTVFVEGKVYFDVSEDINCPFYVKTESYMVKVLGTFFEVNSYKGERFSDVILVQGSVEILNYNMASLCILRPGQQFQLNKKNNRFQLNEVNVELFTNWHNGKIEFDGMTFGEILEGLERYYNVQLVLEADINKEEKLVGSLSLEKDIYEMMRTIEQVIPIKYEIQTNTVVYIQSK
jgi:ferric-dicitrate binding protein FerR (iron transport regulator)